MLYTEDMKQTTLLFLIRTDDICLAMKKRGFGEGKWNGVGGKVSEGESVVAAAVREAKEEIGVDIRTDEVEKVAEIHFSFDDHPEWEQVMHGFVARSWVGEPLESEEMRPQWFPFKDLPFSKMWIDDPHWVPLIVAGKKVRASFTFTHGGAGLKDYSVEEVG